MYTHIYDMDKYGAYDIECIDVSTIVEAWSMCWYVLLFQMFVPVDTRLWLSWNHADSREQYESLSLKWSNMQCYLLTYKQCSQDSIWAETRRHFGAPYLIIMYAYWYILIYIYIYIYISWNLLCVYNCIYIYIIYICHSYVHTVYNRYVYTYTPISTPWYRWCLVNLLVIEALRAPRVTEGDLVGLGGQ